MAESDLKRRVDNYMQLMRLDRPIGMLLLLYPTLWAIWASSGGRPDTKVFVVFVLGVAVMRSAGCVINDYADREIDLHVERTRQRPLASGQVSPREALLLFTALLCVALGLVLYLDWRLLGLAAIGAVLAATYPFLKRYTHLPQFYLGAAFGWSIPMAYAAHAQPLSADCWWLFAANVFWAAAYDTQYAMVDRNDDVNIGVKSTAILFGRYDTMAVLLLHASTLICLAIAGLRLNSGVWYGLGLTVAAGFVVYQQKLIRNRSREGCFKAFLNNNWFGAAVFFGLLLDYTLV